MKRPSTSGNLSCAAIFTGSAEDDRIKIDKVAESVKKLVWELAIGGGEISDAVMKIKIDEATW
jgi:hypothetical protein